MTVRQSPRPHLAPIRRRLAAASLAIALAAGFMIGQPWPGLAQADGTGAATPPPPTTCQIVIAEASTVRPPVTPEPTPIAESTPIAAPAASPIVSATPVADAAASPVASPASDPDAALRDELAATADALFGCLNERNFEAYAQLTSDAYRGQLFGSDQPLTAEQFVILAQSLADADNRIVALVNLQRLGDDRVSVDVTYVSAYQQRTGTWTFAPTEVDGLAAWVLDSEVVLATEAPDGAGTIDVTLEDGSYDVTPDSVAASDVVLNLDNPTGNDHEALVLLLDEGVTTDALLQNTSASLPEGVELIGQSTVPASSEGTMVLTALPPGEYTIVDLLLDENGIPYLSAGMAATFTVDN